MPAVRFLPERTDVFVPFRAAATTVAEAARLLTDLVTGQARPEQAVARLPELEQRGDEITHEIFTALARNLVAPIHLPPAGQPVEIGGISIHRLADGKLVEHWGNIDALSFMQQLGAVPVPTLTTA